MTKKPTTFVAYLRVSTVRQGESGRLFNFLRVYL